MTFAGVYRKKKEQKKEKLQSGASLKHLVEDSLAGSAGTARMKSRDPVYHLTESFRAAFDLCGRHKAAELAGADKAEADETEPGAGEYEQRRRENQDTTGEFPEYQSTPEEKAQGNFYRKFSDIAFQNGHLASAVLENGGKTMFVSCMKRALGQPGPHNANQTGLSSASSAQAVVKNTSTRVVINRYTDGAVGLVVDSIQSARKTLKIFERLTADPQDAAPGMQEETLRRLYPFLALSGDLARTAQYEERIKELAGLEQGTGDPGKRQDILEQKAVLQAGLTKNQGLIARKRQMKDRFYLLLTQLMENSQKAESIFSRSGFATEVLEEIFAVDESAGDNNNEDDDNNGKPGEPLEKDD